MALVPWETVWHVKGAGASCIRAVSFDAWQLGRPMWRVHMVLIAFFCSYKYQGKIDRMSRLGKSKPNCPFRFVKMLVRTFQYRGSLDCSAYHLPWAEEPWYAIETFVASFIVLLRITSRRNPPMNEYLTTGLVKRKEHIEDKEKINFEVKFVLKSKYTRLLFRELRDNV